MSLATYNRGSFDILLNVMTTFRAPLKSENESKDDASQIQHDAQIQQDPHLGSFIKEEHEALLSGDHEEVEYEDDPEYKKDKTISTVFIGFASIALLGAGIMFLNNQEALHNPIDIVQETLRNSLTNSDAQSTTTEHVSSDIDASIPRDEFMEQYKARLVELQNTVSDRPAQNTSASAEQTAQQNTDATEQELVKSEKSNTSLTNTATNIIQFNREQKLTEIVFSDALGVSFLKDPYWKQTVKNNTVTLSMVEIERAHV